MSVKLHIKYLISLCLCFVIVSQAQAEYGGCWIQKNNVGLSSGLTPIGYSSSTLKQHASVRISVNYFTMIDSVGAYKDVYTKGKGVYYSADSSGSDTTALRLDTFIGQDLQVAFYFAGTDAETLFITVEQALSWYTAAVDTSFDHPGVDNFHYGFFTTDTLFMDSLTDTNDTLYVTSGGSDYAQDWRKQWDTFEVQLPYARIKIVNLGTLQLDAPIYIEMYARTPDGVMSGVAGRLQQAVKPKR